MHGNLEPEENVFDSEPKWDIEDIKKAFIDNAKDYDRIMKKEKDDECVCRNSIVYGYRYSSHILSGKVV